MVGIPGHPFGARPILKGRTVSLGSTTWNLEMFGSDDFPFQTGENLGSRRFRECI